MGKPIIVWFRRDLRTADNPALRQAADSGRPVIPLYIVEPDIGDYSSLGGAANWWLHHSLEALASDLSDKGSYLVVRSGEPADILAEVAAASGADTIYWNRRYEPLAIAADKKLKKDLTGAGLETKSFAAHTLFEPFVILNKQGKPYQVYSAFWRALRAEHDPREPFADLRSIKSPKKKPTSESIDSLSLLPVLNWADAFPDYWQPGSTGARAAMRTFLAEAANNYADNRDIPGISATSALSAHLAFGELSVHTLWHKTVEAAEGKLTKGFETYLKQLIWRDFAYHLLYHFPHTVDEPLRPEFSRFPWDDDDEAFSLWCKGMTGYPIVDAGMRQLWATGWMHNRVRMVVASFLVKDLRIPWQRGAEWFWDTLIDADLANNTMGWQWTAGCGADAAPYFRVFNPVRQGERFDADGAYVRRWVPELSNLPDSHIHAPWNASSSVLDDAGVVLGETYPEPMVDHGEARDAALDAYEEIKQAKAAKG